MKIPQEFQAFMKLPTTKKASISAIAPVSQAVCQNCGGVGRMYIFIGVDGPFRTPSVQSVPKVCAFIDGRWWVGQHFSAVCPVCKGKDYATEEEVYTANTAMLTNQLRSKYSTKRSHEDELEAQENKERQLAEMDESGRSQAFERDERGAIWQR
jgi:hypothetical protein